MGIAGYLIKKEGSFEGQSGVGFNYVLAGNGLFIQAYNDLIQAWAPVSKFVVKGLPPQGTGIALTHGKIPAILFERILAQMQKNPESENYFAIVCKNDGYHAFWTPQTGTVGSVEYRKMENTVMDIHNHPGAGEAWFSPQDDRDEQGLRLSMVISNLKGRPNLRIRAGVYGYFMDVAWSDVFVGDLVEADDLNDTYKCEAKEVEKESMYELRSEHGLRQDNRRRLWWDRIFTHRRPV